MNTPTARLGDLVTITGGGTPRRSEPSYWGPEIPWASVKDLSGPELNETAEHITRAGLRNSAASLIPTGSVILATRMAVGRAAINSVDLAINQDLKALYCTSDLDPRYLLHFLRQREAWFERLGRGATVKGITLDVLRRMTIPFPPLAEQRRSAAILDRADAIRQKRRQAVGLLEEFLRSGFLETVGPGNPAYASWRKYRIEDLADECSGSMRTGPFGSALRHSEFVNDGVAVIGIDNAVQNRFAWGERRFITVEKYEEFRRYAVKPGDVIITIMGTTGRSAVIPDDIPVAISTKHLAVITPNRELVEPQYLSHAMHMDPGIQSQILGANRGAIMSGLNLGIIRRLELRLPPRPVQEQFLAALYAGRSAADRLADSERLISELFDSLAQRVFRGEA